MRAPRQTARTSDGRSQRSGVAVVELALVLPVFFLVIFAGIEFSRLNMLRHLANTSAYEAARSAMVPGGTTAEAQAAANVILGAAGITNASVTSSPSPFTEDDTEVSVTVSIPVIGNLWMTPMFASGSFTSSCTLATERREE